MYLGPFQNWYPKKGPELYQKKLELSRLVSTHNNKQHLSQEESSKNNKLSREVTQEC